MITVGSLFSGIGGLDLGLERAGFRVRWQVEIGAYNRAVLAKHWPDVERFEDVRDFPPAPAPERYRVDVIAGGFPCQDVSFAGRRAGLDGARSGLWGEFARIVRILRPRYVLVENVPGIRSPIKHKGRVVAPAPIGRVLGDLAALGFDAEWHSVPASALGAAHRRDRVFVLAYPSGYGGRPGSLSTRQGEEGEGATNADRFGARHANDERIGFRCGRCAATSGAASGGGAEASEQRLRADSGAVRCPQCDCADDDCIVGAARPAEVAGPSSARAPGESGGHYSPFVGSGWWGSEPEVVRMVYGVPRGLVRPALAGLGNAVVPQVAEEVGRRLLDVINQHGL